MVFRKKIILFYHRARRKSLKLFEQTSKRDKKKQTCEQATLEGCSHMFTRKLGFIFIESCATIIIMHHENELFVCGFEM